MNQITLKYTDVSLTSDSQACSYGGGKQTHHMALVVMLLFPNFRVSTEKKKEEINFYCGLPAVNKMALTERKGTNSESGKEHIQNQGVSI